MYKLVRLVLNRYLAASFGKHLLQHVGSENHTGLSQSTVHGLWRQVGLQHKHVPSCQFLHRIRPLARRHLSHFAGPIASCSTRNLSDEPAVIPMACSNMAARQGCASTTAAKRNHAVSRAALNFHYKPKRIISGCCLVGKRQRPSSQ